MSVAVKNEAGAAGPSRERVELILSQLDRLPTLPPVAARLLAMATSENYGVRDLVEIIQLDPALTAGLLRMVRRADLGVRQKDMTVAKAVGLLGLRAVRNAVLCSEFFEVLGGRDTGDSAALRRDLWLHAIAVASTAEWIAEKLSLLDLAGPIFVCGLLHDVGKIALQYSLPKSYQRVVERVSVRRVSLCDAEQEVFGLDHTVAGKRLVTRWSMEPAVVESVWLHHQDPAALPTFVTCPEVVRIVRSADEIVRSFGLGFSGAGPADPEPGAVQLGLSTDAVAEIGGQLASRMAPLLEALGLEADVPGLAQPLDIAHQNLRRVCADLTDQNRILAARGRLLNIIGAFTAKASQATTIADVCAAAASAVCAELQAAGTCVFALDRERGVCFAGWCEAQGPVQIDAFELAAVGHETPSSGQSNGHTALGSAIPPHMLIWRQCFGWTPETSLSHLAIDAGRVEAGILLARDDDRLPPIHAEPTDWAVLARTIGGSLFSARARSQSERAAEELLDANRRLREAQVNLLRMRSIAMVSEMAAGAAHELNNPLAVISGRAQMELSASPEGDRRKAMEVIIAQTNKAAQIVLDLMSFAKPDPPSPISQPLSAVLDAVYQHWQGRLGERRNKLSVTIQSYDATVYVDTAQVIDAINEVVANATLAADSAEGRVTINSPSRPSDETVRIVVEDNGSGMSPDVLEHAIDPFFSSRPAGRGRGLGLSKAYRLIEINGGNLWIDSKQGVGTTVTIELPARAER